MTFLQKALIFLTWLSVGIMQPVLSLLLLSRGATLATLAAAVGAYTLTAFAAEFPSGIFADLRGRKTSYQLAQVLNLGSSLAMVFSHTIWQLLAAMVLMGLGRAFSSGSIDALIIDDCLARHGAGYTARITSQMAFWQGVGLSAGALAGGFLPARNGYAIHLIVKAGIILIALLCSFSAREKKAAESARPNLSRHIGSCLGLVKTSSLIKILLAGTFAAGILMSAVEIYWQPAFVSLADPGTPYLKGIVSFIGFGMVIIGDLAMQKLNLRPDSLRRLYFLLLSLIGGTVILFAVQRSAAGFILCYGGMYLAIGMADISEQSLLNDRAGPQNRASLLSLLSFTAQAGSLLASGAAGIFIGRIGFGGLWIASGILMVLLSGGAFVLCRKRSCGAALRPADGTGEAPEQASQTPQTDSIPFHL